MAQGSLLFFADKMSEHINEERLCDWAVEPQVSISRDEDLHFSDCPDCIRQYVKLLKGLTVNEAYHLIIVAFPWWNM